MDSDNTHRIGRVAGVESERLIVELDQAASGFVKAGSFGVLPVGAVNSYVTVAAGASRVVAVVTAVRILQERHREVSAFGHDAAEGVGRIIEATMIGRLIGDRFESGVTTYPSLFSPVAVATRSDLEAIFRPRSAALRVGSAVVSPDQDVWLDPDRLLSRHFAILGSTGSGKSCSVLAVLDGLLELGLPHSNVIIFDANGEYGAAFAEGTSRGEQVTSYQLGPELGPDGISAPFWFMNNDEHMELLRAAEGLQAPMLQRSIADARITGLRAGELLRRLRVVRRTVDHLIDIDRSEKKPQEKLASQFNELTACLADYVAASDDLNQKWQEMQAVLDDVTALGLSTSSWDPLGAQQRDRFTQICQELGRLLREALSTIGMGTSTAALDFDAPSYYSFEDLAELFLPQRIALEGDTDPRIGQFMSTLQMRLERLLADDRYAFMSRVERFDEALGRFLRLVFGKEPLADVGGTPPPWAKSYSEAATSTNEGHCVTIIDFSHVASDILPTVTAMIARLTLELAQRLEPRGSMPTLLVLEEAHRYVTRPHHDRRSQASLVFERIAKEGRKFGVSLCLASQRPSELDPTVLSQCGTVFAHRIASQIDQDLVRAATPMATRDVLRQLPGLATQHAIVLGEAIPAPTAVRIRSVGDLPNSQDPAFIELWRAADPHHQAGQISEIAEAWERGHRSSM